MGRESGSSSAGQSSLRVPHGIAVRWRLALESPSLRCLHWEDSQRALWEQLPFSTHLSTAQRLQGRQTPRVAAQGSKRGVFRDTGQGQPASSFPTKAQDHSITPTHQGCHRGPAGFKGRGHKTLTSDGGGAEFCKDPRDGGCRCGQVWIRGLPSSGSLTAP